MTKKLCVLVFLALAPLLFGTLALAEKSPNETRSSKPIVPGKDVVLPELVQKTKPVYPEKAKAKSVMGKVILQAVITTEGAVSDVKVLRSSPPDYGFEEAAKAAVEKWKYKPATKDGNPVAIYLTVVVEFSQQ